MRLRSAFLGTGMAAVLAGITVVVIGATSVRRWLHRPRPARPIAHDRVDEAVEQSFPASDPPAHAVTMGATANH